MRIIMTLFGKSVLLALRMVGRKGSALPGLYIERLAPTYLPKMLSQLPRGVILVTGTSGKTTTTKIISELLKANGLKVLTNPTGSNFVRGIVSTMAKHATPTGRLPYDIAVFEQDEAYAVHFVKRHQPVGVVALNITRDQMDRFGEIDTTAKLIAKVVAAAQSWVVLNANDKRIASLAERAKDKNVVWFGHSKDLQNLFVDDDQLYSKNLRFFQAAEPEVCLTGVSSCEVQEVILNQARVIKTQLDGTHNAINITAALAALVAEEPKIDTDLAIRTLESIKPAFGRGETVHLASGQELRLQLVKNPSGFRHALRLVEERNYETVGIVINDEYADGRDVSWLWDVDFSVLHEQKGQIVCGGTRATDMALRLKYDELIAGIASDLDSFLKDHFKQQTGPSIIFCTYTAMLGLRKILKQQNRQLAKEGL